MENPPSPVQSDVSMRSARSTEPSDVSMRSARSTEPSDVYMQSARSTEPSDVSMRSAWSTEPSNERIDNERWNRDRAPSPSRSSVSMESDYSNLEMGRRRRLEAQDTCETHNQKWKILMLEKENAELTTGYKALKHENAELTKLCLETKLLDTEERQLEMVRMRAECVQEPSLGRPIHPGMLYDCRSESFTSVPLWDSDAVTKGTVSQSHTTVDTQVIKKQSLKNRCLALGMKKRMRTSFLSGMVEVGGAGRYLSHNTIDFDRKYYRVSEYSCVTLHYKKTARVDQLCPSLLEKVTRPEVIRQQTATHVVMAVTYGTQAFLVFQGNGAACNVPGEKLADLVRGVIPCCRLTAQEPALPLLDATLAYYGDHGPPRVIKDSKEAVDLCRSLHGVMGPGGEKAVPLTVWLYPLSKLDPAAAYVRAISADLQTRMEEELEACRESEFWCESMKTDQREPLRKKSITITKIMKQINDELGNLHHNKSLVKTVLVTLRSKIQNERFLLSELESLSSTNKTVTDIKTSFQSCYEAHYDDDYFNNDNLSDEEEEDDSDEEDDYDIDDYDDYNDTEEDDDDDVEEDSEDDEEVT